MIFPPVYELSYVGVADAGVPNGERLLFRPTELVNVAQFGILVGRRNPDGTAVPFYDHFFWFGELVVSPPSWIIVYTGPGQFQETKLPETGETAYVYHWGKSHTVFHVPDIVPVVFRIGGVVVGQRPIPPQATPALSRGRP